MVLVLVSNSRMMIVRFDLILSIGTTSRLDDKFFILRK